MLFGSGIVVRAGVGAGTQGCGDAEFLLFHTSVGLDFYQLCLGGLGFLPAVPQ